MKIKPLFFSALYILFSLSTFGQNSANLSPYDCIYNHLYYLQDDSYEPFLAGRSFPSSIDSTERKDLAIQLKQIFDGKGMYIRLEEIPDSPDFYDSIRNVSIYTLYHKELPQIFVVKSDQGWVYSDETVNAIPNLHKSVYPFGLDMLLKLFPQKGSSKFLGLSLWQYSGIGIFILLCGFLFLVIRYLIGILIRVQKESNRKTWNQIKLLGSSWISLKVFGLLLPVLLFPVKFMENIKLILGLATSLLFLLILLKLANVILSYVDRFTRTTESKMDEQLLPVLKRAVQFVIVAFWLLHLLTLLGVNITTLIAGISIGGLAIALAAQDTLKNLFGSVTIFLDKPFQIGDSIKVGGTEGTVEEVGFRSTRIRSFANSLIYVPNSKLSDSTIDNFGLRQYRRYKTMIGLMYNTPPAKINAFVAGLKKIVEDHPHTRKDAYEIHLNNLGDSAIEILFYIFFKVDNWSEELTSKHDLLMSILTLAEDLGVSFAFPSTSVYMEN